MLSLAIWVFASISQAGVNAASPDFQNMKIPELKAFLEARGETCADCVEKSQFVKRAVLVQDRPPATKEQLKQEIFDEINSLRETMGLGPASAGEMEEQVKESLSGKAKEKQTADPKKTVKKEAEKSKPKVQKPDTKSTKEESKTKKTEEKKPKSKPESGKTGEEEKKKTKPEQKVKTEDKKTSTAKKSKKATTSEESEETDVKEKPKTKEQDKKKKAPSKAETTKKQDKKPEEKKGKSEEKKPDSKKTAKSKKTEETPKTKKETETETKKTESKSKAPKKSTEEKKPKEDKEEESTEKSEKKAEKPKAKPKDTKKPAKDKAKEKSADSGSIGAVWRTRGVKACESVLKEDAKSALALPDICTIYGAAIFEVFEEFDKNMGGLSILGPAAGGFLGGAKKGGLKTTSLTQPFLAAGLRAVKVAATASIAEANKLVPKPPPPTCPEVMCSMFCEHGNKKDEQGCEICACKEACPEVMCSMFCEHGFKQDENGCDTCVCQEEAKGGKKDEHGCALGGGYTWCERKSKCLRTWEEPCEEGVEPVGGNDEHGCARGGGYTWCEAKSKCLRTWEEPCEVVPPAPEEKSLSERIKEITRKETTTWLFDVAMKNPDKLKRQQEFEDMIKKNKFGEGWDSSSSPPPSSSRGKPVRSGKVSEAESYFDNLFEEKEVPVEDANPKAGKIPPTLLRKGYNRRDSRSHVLEPEESEGVLDLDGPHHDEI